MEEQSLSPDVQDALAVLQRYLSDSIAPLQAADALGVLQSAPRAVVAEAIGRWAAELFRGPGSEFLYSDLLFLGLKRLYSFNDFHLLPQDQVLQFLEELKSPLLMRCPEEERPQLEQNLSVLNSSGTDFSSASPRSLPGATMPSSTTAAAGAIPRFPGITGPRRRGITLVLERLARSRTPGRDAAPQPVPSFAPQIFAAAALGAHDSAELEQACGILQAIGLPINPQALFRMMGSSLPGWSLVPPPPAGGAATQSAPSPMLEAMSRIVQFAGSSRESANRWEELVKAAVEQLNQGSPSRAAAMIGLAENILPESSQELYAVANLRSGGHQFVDIERLRTSVENAQNHPHLRKVMGFFDELRPEGLLQQLEGEPKRNRRRLLLDLLEVHGEAARIEALRLLGIVVAERGGRVDRWHFPRNLVYLLHRIHPASGAPTGPELDMVAGLLDPARSPSLVKEAITYFGQYRHQKSEDCLTALVARLESRLANTDTGKVDPVPLRGLLDRAAFALARLGTPGSIRVLRVHALKANPELGNTLARLVHLASQDISTDPQSVEAIVNAAREALPRRLLGMRIRKESREISNLIASLSSTPTPEVQQLMKEISERFPSEEYGQAALKCLQDLEAASRKTEEGGSRMMGDLDLFGLPGLLQQLERSRASGTLSLKEKSGGVIGELDIQDGKLARCSSGRMSGDAAFYRLLEKPAAASFVFQERRAEAESSGPEPLELAPLIEEGTRRFDEFEWLRVVVPDGAELKAAGERPSPDSADPDEVLCQSLWHSATTGSTPSECESLFPYEPLRIRRILSRWLEAGILSER